MSYDYSGLPLSPRGCLFIVLGVPITLIAILYVINLFYPGAGCCGGM